MFRTQIGTICRRLYSRDVFSTIKEKARLAEQNKPEWDKRDQAHQQRYGEWNPTRKLTRQQMQDVRNFLKELPHLKTADLAQYFGVSPEAIRRILKLSWVPKESEEASLLERETRRKERNKEVSKELEKSVAEARKQLQYARSSKFEDVVKAPKTERPRPYQKYRKYEDKNVRPRREYQRKGYVKSAGDIID